MVRHTIPKAVRKYTGGGLPKPPALLALQPPEPSGGALVLPTHCTGSEERVCHLAKNLPAVNGLLYFAAAEVTEVALGKFALRSLKNCSPNIPEEDEECREYAAVFLHYILAQHRCVESAELLFSSRENRRFILLLSDALKSATSLTCLRLCGCELGADATSNAFAAIQRLLMLHLVELALDKVVVVVTARASLDALTEGLSNTKTLKRLTIVQVDMATKDSDIWKSDARGHRRNQRSLAVHADDLPGAVMRALISNSSLSRLVVDASFSVHKYGGSFKQMLANPWAPAELTVMCRHRSHRRKANLLFEALMTNTKVKTLCVDGFDLDPVDAKSISKLLAHNNTLEDVSLVEIMWTIRRRHGTRVHADRLSWHVQHLVRGLAATKSLRRLAVKFAFSTREMHRLVLAAVNCATLEELHISRVGLRELPTLYEALVRAGSMAKLTVGMLSAHTNMWSVVLLNVFSSVLELCPGMAINRMFTSLRGACRLQCQCGGDHLSSLEVMHRAGDGDPVIASALRAYLPLTRSLRRLDMRFPALPFEAHSIIEGITLNNSIEELSLKWLAVCEEDVEVLCDWLARSRRLHSLQLALADEGDELVLQILSTLLQKSYTLTSIDVNKWPDDEVGLNAMNLVRRNYGLVQCAAGFVLGSSLKRAAVAFELVSWHPQFSTAVQRMGSLSETDAALKIREGARRLHDEFWQLTGIVKAELECNPPQRGEEGAAEKPQLDELGYYMLEHVRSFLKVSDVLDEEDGQRPSHGVPAREAAATGRRRRAR